MRSIIALVIPLLLAGCDKTQPSPTQAPQAQPPQAQVPQPPPAPPPPPAPEQEKALAALALHRPDPDHPPPLCSDAVEDVVRIDIDQAGHANPESCTVGKQTDVWWWQADNVAFETDFTTGIPDVEGQKHFKSDRAKNVRFAGFKTKHVDGNQKIEYPYTITMNAATTDPAVIIDPTKNK